MTDQPPAAAAISARNVFDVSVQALVAGPINCELTLALPGGDLLVAVITQASVQALGLGLGSRALAIVKAPWVVLATGGSQPMQSSAARNLLAGTVSSVQPGPVNAEVTLRLPGGSELHAVVTSEAVAALGLAPDVAAQAIIKASQVVLAS